MLKSDSSLLIAHFFSLRASLVFCEGNVPRLDVYGASPEDKIDGQT